MKKILITLLMLASVSSAYADFPGIQNEALDTLSTTAGMNGPLSMDAENRLILSPTGSIGGVQYEEDDVAASVTGTAIMWRDAGNEMQPVDSTHKLPVVISDGSGAVNVIVDSGTVVLGAGAASIGTLGANSGVDIGDVTINNAAGASAVNIQDGGNTITVDGTVTVTDGSGALNVIVDSSALPSGAASLAEQQTQTTSLQLLDDVIATADSAFLTKLAQIGGKAVSALPSVVTANDAVITTHDLAGRIVTLPYTMAPLDVYNAVASTAETTIISAPGSGLSIYLTSATYINDDAAVANQFVARKGTAGSVFSAVRVGAPSAGVGNVTLQLTYPTPIKIGDNTLMSVEKTDAQGTVQFTYFIGPS